MGPGKKAWKAVVSISSIHLAILLLLCVTACGGGQRAGLGPGPGRRGAVPVTEIGDRPLRVLIVPTALPSRLADNGRQIAWLKSSVVRLASSLGLAVDIKVASIDPSEIETRFAGTDLVAGCLADSPALRAQALLLPFFPLPGDPASGPIVAFWAATPDKPLLAAAAARALSDARADGGLAADLDAAFGAGTAKAWFDTVRYDGILRAQYLALSPEELGWLRSRLARGGALKVAVRAGGPYAYLPQADGSIKGFDWDLVTTLASSLGLKLELSVARTIADFFTKDGVMPADLGKAEYDYTPDLLRAVDLYANPMGVTPWRQRMMRMITIYPTRNQLAGRKGEEVRSIAGLEGKRFAVVKDSVQQKTLEEFSKTNSLGLAFVQGENEDALYALVRAGKADYILDGSVVFALNIDKISDFGISPFFSDLQGVAWAVKKDDLVFASIVADFMEASRDSGLLPALWTKTFHMDFRSYVDAMMSEDSGS